MSNPYDSMMTMEDERRRQRGGDALMDPWADVPGVPAEPEILTDEIEVTPRTQEQVNAGMAELLRRIRERDDPQQASRDYAAELAGGAGVRQALAPAMAPPMPPALPAAPPTMPAAPPAMQSPSLPPPVPQGAPLASTTPPMGAAPPMPAQTLGAPSVAAAPPAMPPPALTTPRGQVPPQAPPQDGTAGSEAQALAAPRPPGAQMPPTQTRPADAMAKSMGGPSSSGVQARMGSGPGLVAQGPSFDDRVADAQARDDRRERWRSILRGVGAILAASTGNVGLMLPGMVGASLVPESDEEETLRAGDTREQALGTEQARQRAVLDQIAQRREAQAAQEREAQQTLALRARELEGTEADRSLRTGIQLRENEREEDLLNPESAVSRRERVALESTLAVQPPEIQRAYAGRLGGMAAMELRSIRDELRSTGNARTMAGGMGRGSTLGAGGGRVGGMNAAPDSFVMNIRMGSPSMTLEQAQATADERWLMMPARQRATWENTEQGVASARALAQNLPGYEQVNPGAVSPAQYAEAQDIVAGEEAFGVAMERALGAAGRVEDLPAAEQAAVRAAGVVGVDATEDMAEFSDARRAIITALNRMAGGGTMDATEYARWDATLPSLSSLRGMAPGAARRTLQAAADRARETAEAEMRARGYRRVQQQPAQGASAQQAPAAPMRMRAPDGTVRDVPPHLQAAARRNNWVPVEGGS